MLERMNAMGWYKTCRDCIYFDQIHLSQNGKEYRCDKSGLYFYTEDGGNVCKSFKSAEIEYQKQKQIDLENKVATLINLGIVYDSIKRKISKDSDCYEEQVHYKQTSKNPFDKIWIVIIAMGMMLFLIVSIHDSNRDKLIKSVNKKIYSTQWTKDTNGIPRVEIDVEWPVALPEDDVYKYVGSVVKKHNWNVQRYKKRKVAYKIKNIPKIKAYYVKEFPGKLGVKKNRIFLISDNNDSVLAVKIRNNGSLLTEDGRIINSK